MEQSNTKTGIDWKDALKNKLLDQPFLVIVLVGLLVWQDRLNTENVKRVYGDYKDAQSDYEKKVDAERKSLSDSRTSLILTVQEQRKQYEEMIKELYEERLKEQEELYEKLLECQSTKQH